MAEASTVQLELTLTLPASLAVVPAPIGPVVEAAPDDNAVLAGAVAARSEVVVSGDSDLLTLESYEGIPSHHSSTTDDSPHVLS
jgi:predicted nucleic acid-binding protein